MVLARRHLVFLVGLFILFSFALSFQWISLKADYLRGISNFGIFRQHVGPLWLSRPSSATTSASAPGTAPKPIGTAQSTQMVDGYLYLTDTTPSLNVTRFKEEFHESETIGNSTAEGSPECPEAPPSLVGPLNIDLTVKITIDDIIAEHGDVSEGGRFKPEECTARQRIAIVVPFRNRETHLKFWLHYLIPILKRQQGDYGIYVIEQFGDTTFNRAKLMNVGFNEAQKEYDYNCFVFSDIDIIPMDDRNLYRCGSNPRHMANAVDKFGFSLPYDTLFGGVVAFSKDQFLKINGYSNVFWGWGGEDDELYNRVVSAGMKVERPNSAIARSKMIVHNRDSGNESNGKSFPLINQAHRRMHIDGVRTIQYKIVTTTKHKLYTKITVDLGQPGT